MYLPTTHDIGDDPRQDNNDARAEQARELYWREFEGTVREMIAHTSVPFLLETIAEVQRDGADAEYDGEHKLQIQDFADDEGWPNVLRVVARAMEQQ